MAVLYNVKTLRPENLSPEEVAQAIAAGTHAFKRGERVRVKAPDGTFGTVAAEDALASFQKGFQFEGAQAYGARQDEKKYGDQDVRTFLESGASAATFGLSDVVLRHFGADTEAMRKRREVNPNAATAGQITGVAGSMVLGGPVSGLGRLAKGAKVLKGATSGVRAVARGGAAIERGVLGAGKSLARRSAAKAVGGAFEGAVYGAGNVVSEAALMGDDGPELTAEKVLAQIGASAIVGGAVAGALPVAGAGFKKATRPARRLGASARRKAAESLSDDGTIGGAIRKFRRGRTEKALGVESMKHAELLERKGIRDDLMDELLKPRDELGGKTIIPKWGDPSREQTRKNIFAVRKRAGQEMGEALDDLEAIHRGERGQYDRLYQRVQDEADQVYRKKHAAYLKELERFEKANKPPSGMERGRWKFDSKTGKKIGPDGRTIDPTAPHPAPPRGKVDLKTGRVVDPDTGYHVDTKTGQLYHPDTGKRIPIKKPPKPQPPKAPKKERLRKPQGPRLVEPKKIAQRIRAELLRDVKDTPGLKGERKALMNAIEEWQGMATRKPYLTFREAEHHKRLLQRKIKKAYQARNLSLKLEHEVAVARIVKEEIENVAERVANKVGRPELLSKFKNAKRLFGMMEEAETIARHKASKRAHRFFSLSDYMTGGALGIIGGPAGLAAGVGHKVLRERGSNILAHLANSRRVQGMAQGTTRRVQTGIRGFLFGGKATTKGVLTERKGKFTKRLTAPLSVKISERISYGEERERAKGDKQAVFRKRYQELDEIVTNPTKIIDRIAPKFEAIQGYAPSVGQAMLTRSLDLAHHLHATAPRHMDGPILPMGADPSRRWKMPETEIDKWFRRLAVADDPSVVFDRLGAGVVTMEEMETLRIGYPALYAWAGQEILRQTAELDEPLPFNRRKILSIWFDVPADASYKPDFGQRRQADHAQSPGQGQGEETQGGLRASGIAKLSLGQRSMTQAQRLEAGI